MRRRVNQEIINNETEDFEEIDLEEIISMLSEIAEEEGNIPEVERTIHFNNEVSDSYLNDTLMKLMKWETEDLEIPKEDRMPINFYLNSDGGYLTTGFAIIDFIREMETPVNMIVTKAYSMAATMLMSVPVENRFMFKNSTILIHEVSGGGGAGGLTKVCNNIDFARKISKICDDIIVSGSKIPRDKLEEKKSHEWYIFADEAKELGLVGFIIGEDCSLQQIL